MKAVLLFALVVLLYGCGSKEPKFDSYDNPAERAYYSALHYYNFFGEVEDTPALKKHRQEAGAFRARFESSRRLYDSHQNDYLLNNSEEVQKRILSMEGEFRAWEKSALKYIQEKGLKKPFERYDVEFQEKVRNNIAGRSSEVDKLKDDIRAVMEASGIPCLDVGKAESGCLWVYTTDNGRNRDGLAKTLCYTAGKYSITCVTIVDAGQSTLGRSMCR